MCRKSQLGLNHKNPKLFVRAQWRIPKLIYLIYRVLVAIFFITWIILSGVIKYNWAHSDDDRKKWFIYMTNWSFTLVTLGAIIQALICIYDACSVKSSKSKNFNHEYKLAVIAKDEPIRVSIELPWHYKVAWVFYNVSSLSAVMVTVLFWALLYPQYRVCHGDEVLTTCGSQCTRTCAQPQPLCVEVCEERCQCPHDSPYWHDGHCMKVHDCPQAPHNHTANYTHTELYDVHYVSIMIHAGNSIYVFINLFITAMPMRLLHYTHYAVYAVLYTGFTVVYHLAGGTNAVDDPYIYSVIDWRYTATSSIYIVGCLVLSLILWLLLCGLTELRVLIYRKFCAPIRNNNCFHGQHFDLIAGTNKANEVEEESKSSF